MTDLATPQDVEELFRPLTDAEGSRVERLLRLASSTARARVVTLDARIADGSLDPLLVADVVAGAVVRALRNPDGIKSQTIGPESVTYDDRVASGRVSFTAEELSLLRPATSGSRVRSIRLAPGLA